MCPVSVPALSPYAPLLVLGRSRAGPLCPARERHMFLRVLALLACCSLLDNPCSREEDAPLPPPPPPPSPPSPPRDAFILDDDEENDDSRQSVFHAMDLDERDENETEEDDDGDDEACASGPSQAPNMPWKKKQKIPVQSKKAMTMDYNHKMWVVEPDGEAHTLITCLVNGAQYRVCNNRLKKALIALDPNTIARTVLTSTSCGAHCKHQCWTRVCVGEILVHRNRHATCESEGQINETIARYLTQFNPNANPGKQMRYVVNGKEVCADFYANTEGICGNKLRRIRKMVQEGVIHCVHGNKGVLSDERAKRHAQGVAFWSFFCERFCQRPATVEEILLFPLDWPYEEIYDAIYIPWHAKACPGVPLLSASAFYRARWDDKFSNVKRRSTHRHAKCHTCKLLAIRRRKLTTDAEKAQYELDRDFHNAEKQNWRNMEESSQRLGKADPEHYAVFQYDDTSSLGIPKFTKRDFKNLGHGRLHFVPLNFTDFSSNNFSYIYHGKAAMGKGANRICTVLYTAIRMMKFGRGRSRFARNIICLADNYSENKCNELFAFAVELVSRNWVDSVEFLFGPPGHTHNGSDACHRLHNDYVTQYDAYTLGEFILNYGKVWRDGAPTAALLNFQYDWKKRYKRDIDRLGGFLKDEDVPAVQAFRVHRTMAGTVEVRWKHRAADKVWFGREASASSGGFHLLKRIPSRPLKVVMATAVTDAAALKELLSDGMRRIFEECRELAAYGWITEVCNTGKLPLEPVDDPDVEAPPDQWGRRCLTGVEDKKGVIFVMEPARDLTQEAFWAQPAELVEQQAELTRIRAVAISLCHNQPLVRYAREKRQESGMYAANEARQEHAMLLTSQIMEARAGNPRVEADSDDDRPLQLLRSQRAESTGRCTCGTGTRSSSSSSSSSSTSSSRSSSSSSSSSSTSSSSSSSSSSSQC